jgi:hypothetical protein
VSERMKILIAYDGSIYANAALDDLPRAGLPRVAEALIMSVAYVFLPPPSSPEPAFTAQVPAANSVRLNFCMAVELSDASGQYERSIQFPWPIH